MLDPTATPTETPDPLDERSDIQSTETGRRIAYPEPEERHASDTPAPLWMGPFDHEAPLASVRTRKKEDAQVRETVQFMALMSFDVILYGGWRAGRTSRLYGGVPFLGVREMSVHCNRCQLGMT